MSEKIYAWLLRLYPSSFQKAYGREALQLFRDRARDERGFLSGLRLWLDLLSDLAISIPRSYRTAPASLVASRAEHRTDGTPSFSILEDEALSLGSLLYGGVTSLLVYPSIFLLIAHGGNSIPALNIQQPLRYSGAMTSPFSFSGQALLRHSGAMVKPTPTLTLAHRPAAPGSTVTVTATVHAVGAGPTPTGYVRFFDGSAVLNLGKLSDGAVTIKGKLPHITTHSLSAIYYGDANYSSAISIGEAN